MINCINVDVIRDDLQSQLKQEEKRVNRKICCSKEEYIDDDSSDVPVYAKTCNGYEESMMEIVNSPAILVIVGSRHLDKNLLINKLPSMVIFQQLKWNLMGVYLNNDVNSQRIH